MFNEDDASEKIKNFNKCKSKKIKFRNKIHQIEKQQLCITYTS